jgi:hypothetical protein
MLANINYFKAHQNKFKKNGELILHKTIGWSCCFFTFQQCTWVHVNVLMQQNRKPASRCHYEFLS